jgi:hypothetical protein
LKIAHIICIKWGTEYTAKDVNNLFFMCKKNIHLHTLNFHCFTDRSEELHKDILVHSLPILNVAPEDNKYSYKKEAALCDDNLGELKGLRVLFFDLDVVITDEIDSLITFPQNDEFIITKDWNKNSDKVGNASCYSWVVGTLGSIKTDFEETPQKWVKKFYTASQEYLSFKVIEKFGKLNFYPKEWVVSFKSNCMPPFYLRYFKAPKLPQNAKVIAFHGQPKILDALSGKWQNKGSALKKIYKKTLPAIWLEKFLDKDFINW